jgi:hypothetical protein
MTAMILLATLSAGQIATADAAWLGDYGLALQKTKEQGKPLLIVIDLPGRSVTRGEAARVEPAGYAAGSEGSEALKDYVLCRIDASSKYGRSVVAAFQATTLPHTAIIDRRGASILYTKQGQFSSSEWTTTLTSYRHGVRPVSYQPVASQSIFQLGGCST